MMKENEIKAWHEELKKTWARDKDFRTWIKIKVLEAVLELN